MRILFCSTDFQPPERADGSLSIGATAYYRLGLQSRTLASMGGHGTYVVPSVVSSSDGTFAGKTFQGNVLDGADVVVLQRATNLTVDQVTAARRAGQVVVWDLDDLLFESPRREMAKGLTGPGVVSLSAESFHPEMYSREHLLRLLGAVDAVTVSTPYLAQRVQKYAPKVKLLRNAISLDDWEVEDVSDGPVLGWTAMLSWRAHDQEPLTRWLGAFLEKHDLRFVHVGHEDHRPSLASLCRLDPERVETRPMQHFASFLTGRPLQGVDIQLVPLIDHPWNEAKSALKGLESAASGVPFVASPSGEYRRLGIGTVLACDLAHQKPRHWEAAIEPLLDRSERERVSREVREAVAAHDIRARWREWETVYAELLDISE